MSQKRGNMKSIFKKAMAIGAGLIIGLTISMLVSTQIGALYH